MIYNKNIRRAMQFAESLHHGQTDKGGYPYVFHPFYIALQMDTEAEICVALLHDTIEDTKLTDSVLSEWFSAEICDAIKLLTHKRNQPYKEYIERIKPNPLARKVKIADLKHNLDTSRLADELKHSEIYKFSDAYLEHQAQRIKKYQAALKYLEDETNED